MLETENLEHRKNKQKKNAKEEDMVSVRECVTAHELFVDYEKKNRMQAMSKSVFNMFASWFRCDGSDSRERESRGECVGILIGFVDASPTAMWLLHKVNELTRFNVDQRSFPKRHGKIVSPLEIEITWPPHRIKWRCAVESV